MSAGAAMQFVVRRPSGDPAAARRLAAAFEELAAAVRTQCAIAARILDDLGTAWTGTAARAAQAPQVVLVHDAAQVSRALTSCADELRDYAQRLQHAHEHHGWSLGRLVAMGALVTVGAAAVMVTVGAAAPVEAVAATAAAEAAEAATAAAGAAGAGAATGLSSWEAMFAAVRPLAPFLTPHLVSAASSVGLEAITELLETHRLDLQSLEVAAGVGFTGSTVSGVVEQRLAATSSAVRRLGEAGVYAAAGSTGQYIDDGGIDPVDSAASGVTGVVARDVRRVTADLHHRWRR